MKASGSAEMGIPEYSAHHTANNSSVSVCLPRPLALRDMRRCVEPPALVGEGPSLSSPSRESLSKPALGGPFCAVSRLITFVKAVCRKTVQR
jgi:hypothetical protein